MSAQLREWRWPSLLVAAFILQVAIAWNTRFTQPDWAGVPPVPSMASARIMSGGDGETFFRMQGFGMQNLGDEGGRMHPLYTYDMARVARWLRLIDQFSPASDYMPFLAGYLYSYVQKVELLRPLIDYLADVSDRRPATGWRWGVVGSYLAKHRLNDVNLALDLSYRLAALPNQDPLVPVWLRQMPAYALADVGKKEAARDVMAAIIESSKDMQPMETWGMKEFLRRLDEKTEDTGRTPEEK
ncbi:MAG: hypothetical protein WCK65_05980 [Rhodospirillaceae bacterium]